MSGLRRSIIIVVLACAFTGAPVARAATSEGSFFFGTNGGGSAMASFAVSPLAVTLPLRLRGSLGYAAMNPGAPENARHVFINDASGGTPEKHGRLWTLGFDFLCPIAGGSERRLDAYAGPRYGLFDAHFRYVGDNEEFDVTTHSWGAGAGLEGSVALGTRVAMSLLGGAEAFLPSDLHGHDATYSPNDENINARGKHTYADADQAIHQPKVEARIMAGITYRFGR